MTTELERGATPPADTGRVGRILPAAGPADVPAAPTAPRGEAPIAVRLEALGTDPDAIITEVGGIYAGRGWDARSTERPFSYRYTAVGDDTVTLRRSRVDGHVRGLIPHTDDFVLQWITEGQAVPDTVRDGVALTPGIPMLFPTDREFAFDYRDFDQRLVHLSRDLVREVAVERHHVDPEADLVLDHLRVLDAHAVTRWRAQTALLVQELRHGVDTLLWHEATRRAAALFLDLYPPDGPELPPVVLLPRRARLRAAVEYVHGHAHEPLVVSDIAAAAGLSVRALQEAFQHNLGRTPMTYLLAVRLDRVRRELLRADPATTSVQHVARRWGFSHLGRFSGTYLRTFGEYPRQTLRR